MKGLTRSRNIATWLLLLGTIPLATGCVGLASHIMYIWQGTSVAAESKALEHKKVAVLCMTSEGYFDRGGAEGISLAIEQALQANVKGIKLIPHAKVADWIDNNDSYRLEPKTVGAAVKCERLLVVEIDEFSIVEGETLYRGRARYKATVYDFDNGGKICDQKSYSDFRHPTHTERAQIDQSEESFRQEFIFNLARVVARRYHVYDKLDDIASDKPTISQ